MILGILEARMSSRRLPGKVLSPIVGQPMLGRQIERVQRARSLDRVVVATSNEPDDDPIEALCQKLGVACYRGPLEDVLGRFAGAARAMASSRACGAANCRLPARRLGRDRRLRRAASQIER